MRTPFLGPSQRSRSKNLSDQLCINLYPEIVDSKSAKQVGAFYMTPGLDLKSQLGSSGIRPGGEHVARGVLYAVSGNSVFSVDANWNYTLLGTLTTDTGPVSIIDNGPQVVLFDGVHGYFIGNIQVVSAAAIASPGTGYVPTELITLAGGSSITAGILKVTTTKGVQATKWMIAAATDGRVTSVTVSSKGTGYDSLPTLTVHASTGSGATLAPVMGIVTNPKIDVAGTGGNDGDQIVTGTTGTGTKFQVKVRIVGGIITKVLSIQLRGAYTAMPASLQHEPVTGSSLTGAQLDLRNCFGVVSVNVTAGGTGYPTDGTPTISVTGGTPSSTAKMKTPVINTFSGSNGTPGDVTLTGTTGTGTKFQIKGTIDSSGMLSKLAEFAVAGSYTVNPTVITSEPVTGGGLTGARLSILLGVEAVTVNTAGSYQSNPTNPVAQQSSSGAGTGATFNLTFGASPSMGLTVLSLPFSGPVSATYQDGFGLVNVSGTNQFYQSNLLDLAHWQALNFSSADSQPDNVLKIISVHREVWLIKEHDSEVWINAGLPGFAFQRLEGVFVEAGILAPSSLARSGQSLIWLLRSKEGQAVIGMTTGYQIERISTEALEYEMSQYSTLEDGIGYTYLQEGHLFYVLNFPTADVTWVYDVTISKKLGQNMWHQRASFANGAFSRHLGNAHALFNGLNVVGDYSTGNLYAYNMDTLLDNGAQRKWVRSWRAFEQPVEEPTEFNSLRIDMETGLSVPDSESPDGVGPQCVLRWSDDGGHTWSNERIQSAGKVGQVARRVKFNRLGSTRQNSGLDRIFELSSTDQFKVALIGAELEQ